MGKYKFGKVTKAIEKEDFWQVVESNKFQKPSHRAFLILLYYLGIRKIEALRLTRESFEIHVDSLRVDVVPAKHGIERPPFQLSRTLPYVDLIVGHVEKMRKGKRVFQFGPVTAWLIVKRAMGPKYYPHFFRLNRTVHFLNNPEVTQDEIRQWMAWKSLRTVDNYLGYSERTIPKLAAHLG